MSRYLTIALGAAIAASCAVLFAGAAAAIDGEVLITQSRALAGGVTPGDAPGYPVTISASGSYKLASNLAVPLNKTGIEVNAVEVTIDLNGFRINGSINGSSPFGPEATGIKGYQRSLTVRNGTVRNFRHTGISANGAMLIVKDMRISENRTGISCAESCHVEGNIVSYNLGVGVTMNRSGTVLGNTIMLNGNMGLAVSGPVGAGNNTVVNNGAAQIVGPIIRLHPNACAPEPCP